MFEPHQFYAGPTLMKTTTVQWHLWLPDQKRNQHSKLHVNYIPVPKKPIDMNMLRKGHAATYDLSNNTNNILTNLVILFLLYIATAKISLEIQQNKTEDFDFGY
jgi:type II secretory pathway component PulL